MAQTVDRVLNCSLSWEVELSDQNTKTNFLFCETLRVR